MKQSIIKVIWFYVSVMASAYMASYTYVHPEKFIPLTDLLATIVSILIGVSLAISALLATSPTISVSHYKDEAEKKRIHTIIKSDDKSAIDAQTMVFWSYYLALILAIALKWITSTTITSDPDILTRSLTSLFSLVATFSLLWSATLPNLLRQINMQRKDLES